MLLLNPTEKMKFAHWPQSCRYKNRVFTANFQIMMKIMSYNQTFHIKKLCSIIKLYFINHQELLWRMIPIKRSSVFLPHLTTAWAETNSIFFSPLNPSDCLISAVGDVKPKTKIREKLMQNILFSLVPLIILQIYLVAPWSSQLKTTVQEQ